MQISSGIAKLSYGQPAERISGLGQMVASKEIAHLTLRNIACSRDRELYRNRLSQLEAELRRVKHDNERLAQESQNERHLSKKLKEENQLLRLQILDIGYSERNGQSLDLSSQQQDSGFYSFPSTRNLNADRDQQLWSQLVQIVSHVNLSLSEKAEKEFTDSVTGLVASLVQELSKAKTEIRDLIYKTKYSEATIKKISSEMSAIKTKLGQARAHQCMSIACSIALKQKMTKQQVVIRNFEEAIQRLKSMQEIQGKKQTSSRIKTMAVLEGEQVLQDRLSALNKFLEIFASNGKPW